MISEPSYRASSKLRSRIFLAGKHDFQVPVPAAERVNHFLLHCAFPQCQVIGQPEHTSHIGGFHPGKGVFPGIARQNFVKHPAVVQAFEDAAALGVQAFSKNSDFGFVSVYRFCKQQDSGAVRILFLDCGRELESFRRFLLASILLSGAGFLLVFAVVVYCSGRIVRPFAESYEKQKRFITDVGHEIKTPLTVLQADADILEMELGSNEWLSDMRGQIKHLSALTNDLVSLARMEEGETALHLLEIPVSDVISEAAESFRSLAQAQGKTLAVRVEPMLSMAADEKSIRQLIGILLDNALKYSPEGSEITLNFSKQARQLKLTVTNTSSAPLPGENPDILFERFYRVDSSRNSQTGGHGIGLSIAKAIVTAHGGKIHAATIADTALQITAQFPQKS